MFVNSSSGFISASQSRPQAKNLEEPREYRVQSILSVSASTWHSASCYHQFSTTTCLIQFVKNHHDFLRARRSAFSSNSSHAEKNQISHKKVVFRTVEAKWNFPRSQECKPRREQLRRPSRPLESSTAKHSVLARLVFLLRIYAINSYSHSNERRVMVM